jgi:uncharacterized Zn ribbon protein
MTRKYTDRAPRRIALCDTSVADLETMKKAIRYELDHGDRKAVIKALKVKIRQLEAQLK